MSILLSFSARSRFWSRSVMPISFAMGLSSSLLVLGLQSTIPLNLIVHRTVMGVDSFVLLAIPLFIFAGTVMEQGGISERLINFARTLVGRFRGGLPMGVVLGTMLQSGVSGSTVADVSAVSAMTLKPLERAGLSHEPYSLSLISASSAFAILIPPCILMVVVAAVANTSVVAVFAAGLAAVAACRRACLRSDLRAGAHLQHAARRDAYARRDAGRLEGRVARARHVPLDHLHRHPSGYRHDYRDGGDHCRLFAARRRTRLPQPDLEKHSQCSDSNRHCHGP
jgi:hypothetical protein